jgi:PAS domain S-box-containing protein
MGLVAAEGAVEARLWLECPEHQFETSWRRTGSEAPVAEPLLADLRTRATRGDPIVHSEGGVEWTALPIPGREGCAGVLTVGYPDRAGYDAVRLAGLASVLGAKALHFRTQREMSQDRERTADWFKTLDDQIRILEGERQKLAALVNKTDAAVFVTDPEGHITWVNPTMSRRHEQVRHRILPGTTCALLCGMESGCMNCPIRLVREGASIVHQERRERRAEGVRTLYVSAFPVRSPEGTVSSVLVMIQDITDLETLRRSEARYQLLFERSPDSMVMALPGSLEIVMANRQARNVLGIDPGRAAPPTLLELHPRTLQPEMKTRYDALATGSPLENIEVGVLARGESRIMNASGSVFDLDGTDVLLLEFRDVTRLRELQSELARADHLIALGTMNAGIAHEFKNRLAPLRMFAQLLSTDRYDPQRILAHAPLILREVDRLSNLVRDVLDYARPQVPRPAHENLERLAREFTDECRKEYLAVIEETGVRVEFHAEPGSYDVWVDAGQLGRAFLNLFKNGLEALETYSGERVLRVELSRREREVVLALCDSGQGIAPEALGRIFDPFYTTKGPRGTGLGMSITRSLIEANGGVIRVESRTGRGTRAEIRFLEIACADPGTEERRAA